MQQLAEELWTNEEDTLENILQTLYHNKKKGILLVIYIVVQLVVLDLVQKKKIKMHLTLTF